MLSKIKSLLKNKNFMWNTAAGLINAAEAVIVLMVVSRTNGQTDAGIVTFAFAVGNLMSTIGRYGVRNYQVTDVDNKFSFSSYFTSRMITVLLMGLASVAYMMYSLVAKNYSGYKVVIVLLICFIYMIECVEDVFWGLYQRNGRLDIGGRIFFIRWAIHLIVISVMLVLTHNIILALSVGSVCGLLYSLIANIFHCKKYYQGKLFGKVGIWGILKACFPLFLVFFLSNYISNSPKYAIDQYMSSESQAYYGYIAMPIFVIGLLNSFVYQPSIVTMAENWKNREYGKFSRKVWKQLLVVIIFTVLVLAVGYFLGIPVLSWLYSANLSPYKTEFMILLVGGSFLAICGYLCVLMTIMRIQIYTMIGYVAAAIAAYFLTGIFVENWAIMGASWIYLIIMAFLSIVFGIVVAIRIRRFKKQL